MTSSPTVLLVMDYQQGIVERYHGSSALQATADAITTAREHGVPVMFVRVAFRPGFPEISAHNKSFGRVAASGRDMGQDADATQIHPALAPRPDEPIVTKRRVSGFSGSDLEMLLRAGEARTLVLAGIATSGVVLSTLRQAADLDFGLTVLSDACADADPEVHRVLLEKVFPRQAEVVTVDEWRQSL